VSRARRPEERGAATVLVITFSGVLVSVAVACAVVIGLVADHHRAEAAADLAAISAAAVLYAPGGGGDPCAVAAATARHNDAILTDCRIEGAQVWTEVSVRSAWVHGVDLTARSRAGPPLS